MQVLEYRGGWGPDNEEKARHQEVQQQRFDELSKIYDKSHPAGELTVDGQTIRQSSVSNRYGTTKVFESQTLTDKQTATGRRYTAERGKIGNLHV